MCAVAAGTSGRRITGGRHGWWAGVPITTANLTVVAALLLPRHPPGAVVGVLLGGASPLAAGITQLFVLVGLLAVGATAIVLTVELMARGRIRP